MTPAEHLANLRAIAAERQAIAEREKAAIIAAWYDRVPPSKIAAAVERSTTHVRELRPDDVPPARLGGGAAGKDKQS